MMLSAWLRGSVLACCLVVGLARAATGDVVLDPAQEARFARITEHLRCLVCQNQSIAESQAELAVDLKRQVREMLVAGKSESEINEYMVQRYGDFVLYAPPVKTTTLLLWAGPAALLLAGLGGFAWTLRRRAQAAAEVELSAEQHAAAQALLDERSGGGGNPA